MEPRSFVTAGEVAALLAHGNVHKHLDVAAVDSVVPSLGEVQVERQGHGEEHQQDHSHEHLRQVPRPRPLLIRQDLMNEAVDHRRRATPKKRLNEERKADDRADGVNP